MLYDAFGQRIVSTVYTQSNQYRVIYEVEPSMGRSIDSLANLYLPGAKQVPLSSIATFEERTRRCARIGSASSRPPPSPSTWRRAMRSGMRSTPSRP